MTEFGGRPLEAPNSPDPTRECPYVAHRRDRERVYGYPTDLNVCFAQTSYGRGGWFNPKRKRSYASIPVKDQREMCLTPDKWHDCPHYIAKAAEESNAAPEATEESQA